MKLPEQFLIHMKNILGEEYDSFLQSYDSEKKQGLRINTAKISVEEFLSRFPYPLEPVPWTENGFYYREEDPVTKHPFYYAGLYYIQEPSAMVSASHLPIEEGDVVLDLCAAPGGKTTELGSRLSGSGVLHANDISVSRARALLKNVELFGIGNVFVTAEEPEQLYQQFGQRFDKILVDAPCSGEGMFRKDPSLIRSWIQRGPESYAPIQKEVLSQAVMMLKPGGMILYSTCTFSPQEDEEVILDILLRYPDMEIIPMDSYSGFGGGILKESMFDQDYESHLQAMTPTEQEKIRHMIDQINRCCVRIWPHRMDGEGHFAALLQKKRRSPSLEDAAAGTIHHELSIRTDRKEKTDRKDRIDRTDRTETGTSFSRKSKHGKKSISSAAGSDHDDAMSGWEDFRNEMGIVLPTQGRYHLAGEELYWLPEDGMIPKLRYLRTGLLLGEIKKGRFEPSQALAMYLGNRYQNVDGKRLIRFEQNDQNLIRYLKGETVDLEDIDEHISLPAKGWVLVCCENHPIGWGKSVNGMIRNKYQAGWRMMS